MDKNTEEKILKFLNPETTSILAKFSLYLSIIPIISLILGVWALINIKTDPVLKGKNIAIIAIIINLIISIGVGGFIYSELNKEILTQCSVTDNIGCNSERVYFTNAPIQGLFLDILFYNSNNEKITVVDIILEGIEGVEYCDTMISDYIRNKNYRVSKVDNLGIGVPAKSIFGVKMFETSTCKIEGLKDNSKIKLKVKLQYFTEENNSELKWTEINLTTKVNNEPKVWANEDLRVTPSGALITVS